MVMLANDNLNDSNLEISNEEQTKNCEVEKTEMKKKHADPTCSDCKGTSNAHTATPTHEYKEKRERSASVDSTKPEKKRFCCCHTSCNITKESKVENSSASSNSKTGDSLSTASTGINEHIHTPKTKGAKGEQFKFFIGGIPQFITNKDIMEYFEKYGTVQNVMIAQDHRTRRNRGFAFVTMTTQVNKEKILKGPHELNGKRVDVREENNTTPSDIQRKIFVGGLNYFWTKDILTKYFSAFGEIDLVQIVVDSSGRSRCFGFVVFTSEQSVAKVLKQKKHKIHDKVVEVRKAEPKKPKANFKKQHKCTSKCPNMPHHFLNQFPYNKEAMAQWASFMYNTCGMPMLSNQRFQHAPPYDYFSSFSTNTNYYPGSLENMPPPDFNN